MLLPYICRLQLNLDMHEMVNIQRYIIWPSTYTNAPISNIAQRTFALIELEINTSRLVMYQKTS